MAEAKVKVGKPTEETTNDLKAAQGTTLFDFLTTPEGREFGKHCLTHMTQYLSNAGHNQRTELWVRAIVILAIILVVAALTYFGKFDSSIGVLMGTLVGYIFGKKPE